MKPRGVLVVVVVVVATRSSLEKAREPAKIYTTTTILYASMTVVMSSIHIIPKTWKSHWQMLKASSRDTACHPKSIILNCIGARSFIVLIPNALKRSTNSKI